MVTYNKSRTNKEVVTPPPMDESWWQAVLAEETGGSFSPSQQVEEEESQNKPDSHLEHVQSVDWEYARELYLEDQVIHLQVVGHNRGGLLVGGDGLQGFVPVSHILELQIGLNPDEQEQRLVEYEGSTIKLKVIECDPQRGRVVFSERAAQADIGKRNILFQELTPGECCTGVVTNITDFGVFVDLGGVEGLIHVSELSWGRVRHPSDVIQIGEHVRVYVIQVDPQRSRVALSLKRLCQNPWDSAEERYYPGQLTEAVITSIVPFGAFARLEEGLDGLIHVTEIASQLSQNELTSNLSEGQHVHVRVLHVDATKQRLGLSLQVDQI